MTALLLSALGLAVAGLDPLGALIAVGALIAGARPRDVVAFGMIVLVVTPLLGTVLSSTVGRSLAAVDWTWLVPSGRAGAVVELIVAVVLVVWAVLRLRSRNPRPRRPGIGRSGSGRPGSGRSGTAGLVGAGLLFAAGAVLDPTFVGLVVLTGRDEPLAVVVAAHLLWALISQAPLVVVLVALLRGRHEQVVDWFGAWWGRVESRARPVVTGALAVGGSVLAVDAAWWFASGEFLIPGPQ